MRALLEKYPLGYEGYLQEKAKAINREAVAANADAGIEPVAVGTPPPVTVGSEPVAAGVSEQKVSAVTT